MGNKREVIDFFGVAGVSGLAYLGCLSSLRSPQEAAGE